MKEKKLPSRRRPRKPDFSPANSCSRKRLQRHLRERNTTARRSSAAAFNHHISSDENKKSWKPRRRSVGAGNSSELLMMMGSPMMSSLSSEICCGSEFSSTVADRSFATANESFCIMSNDGKMMEASSETAEEVAPREGVKNLIPVKTTERGRWRSLQQQHRSVPLLFSDECCSDCSSNYFCTEYEWSSVDSIVDAPAMFNPVAETGRKEEADKLMAWKEAKTIKLMNKLKKEEASIDAWEKKATARAKMEMKKLEAKLEMKREKGMEKMQRQIKVTKKKAEEKKVRERKAASRQITKVLAAFEKMTLTGKTTWRLLFL